MEQIRHIIFDMGQVLLKFVPDQMLSHWFSDEAEREEMLRIIFASGDWAAIDSGEVSEEEMLEKWIAGSPESTHEPLRQMMANWHRTFESVEGMEELIRELKEKGYGCYLLSNTSMRFFDYWESVASLRLLDGRFISAEHRMMKPSREIFEAMLKTFGLEAETCYFVDDAPENIKGALAVGIGGFCFENYDVTALRRAMRAAGIAVSL